MIMKIKSILTCGSVAIAMLATSCSSEQTDPSITAYDVALQVSVDGIETGTRAIIEGEMLPNGSVFSLWATPRGEYQTISGGNNVPVVTNRYEAKIEGQQILIPADSTIAVSALYPYNNNYTESENAEYIVLDATTGEDFLWGEGCSYATTLQPKVGIRFRHLMSRITLQFTTTDDNESSYEVSSVSLRGEGNSNAQVIVIDKLNGNIIDYEPLGSKSISGVLSSSRLSKNSVLTVDFIIAPTMKEDYNFWHVDMNSTILSDGFTLPETYYQAGVRYIYNVQVSDGNKLVITDCEIVPWENTNMPDINITE